MGDEWWVFLKQDEFPNQPPPVEPAYEIPPDWTGPKNMAPMIGDVKCTMCNGTGKVKGRVGVGGRFFPTYRTGGN